jgi:hypothetical protein
MGKKRVAQLLAQLKENQEKDIENAAGIYTVAKVAVDALAQPEEAQTDAPSLPTQPPITKQELLARYGSFNGCRAAAKKQGIKFSKTPSWEKLETAFSHQRAVKEIIQNYLANFPKNQLQGVSFEVKMYN